MCVWKADQKRGDVYIHVRVSVVIIVSGGSLFSPYRRPYFITLHQKSTPQASNKRVLFNFCAGVLQGKVL